MSKCKQIFEMSGFLIAHLLFGLPLFVFFCNRHMTRVYAFTTGQLLTRTETMELLTAIFAISVALGAASSVWSRRTVGQLALNILTPLGIFLVLQKGPDYPGIVVSIAAVLACILIVYGIVLMKAPIKTTSRKWHIRYCRSKQLANAGRLLLTGSLSVFAFVCMSLVALDGFTITAEHSADPLENDSFLLSFEDYVMERPTLHVGAWNKLTLQEKVNILQKAANIEAQYLGLPEPVTIKCDYKSLSTLGSYSHDDHVVFISRDHLSFDAAADCVSTVLHEMFHAWQHYYNLAYQNLEDQYKDLYLLRNVQRYDFDNYVHGSTDFEGYFYQAVEVDAREYESDRLRKYIFLIDEE